MFVCIDSGGNTQLTYIHTYICFCVASPAPSCVYGVCTYHYTVCVLQVCVCGDSVGACVCVVNC